MRPGQKKEPDLPRTHGDSQAEATAITESEAEVRASEGGKEVAVSQKEASKALVLLRDQPKPSRGYLCWPFWLGFWSLKEMSIGVLDRSLCRAASRLPEVGEDVGGPSGGLRSPTQERGDGGQDRGAHTGGGEKCADSRSILEG